MGDRGIADRTLRFSLRIIRLFREMEQDGAGRIIGRQLLRAGTSIGANVHEAQGAQSRPDFIAKMSIAHKEAYETAYWLKLVAESGILAREKLASLLDETDQIVKILSSILISSKKGKAVKKNETRKERPPVSEL